MSGTPPLRERLLDAAEHLMRTIGLARVTTKEIAREAGCSEAALYKHFSGKEELFIAVLAERLPTFGSTIFDLTEDPGDRTTEQCLVEVAAGAAVFYEAVMPIAGSLFAEPALLRRHRAAMVELNAGPQKPLEWLAGFLRAEQKRGRVHLDADPDAASALILGAAFQRAFLRHFAGAEPASVDDFAARIARTVVAGITTP